MILPDQPLYPLVTHEPYVKKGQENKKCVFQNEKPPNPGRNSSYSYSAKRMYNLEIKVGCTKPFFQKQSIFKTEIIAHF